MITQKAKTYYGTTYSKYAAGYILPDGDMLDFSGKKFGGRGGYRAMDHREVSELYKDEEKTTERWQAIDQFVKDTGAVRIGVDDGGFGFADIIKSIGITTDQLRIITYCFNRVDRVDIDIYNNLFEAAPKEKLEFDYPRAVDIYRALKEFIR